MNLKITSLCMSLSSVLMATFLVASSSTLQAKGPTDTIEQDAMIGWLHGNCFAVKNPNVQRGTKLIVQRLDDTQKAVSATISRPARNGGKCPALLDDRKTINMKGGTHFYEVTSERPIELGIGVIQASDKSHATKEPLDLNNDGRKDLFSQCSTSEGVQFSVWEGAPYKSKLTWSGYYYLGYDAEENCP